MEKEVKILAIESSCDETSAAVVVNGREVLSNVIYSQIDIHTIWRSCPRDCIEKASREDNPGYQTGVKRGGLYTR